VRVYYVKDIQNCFIYENDRIVKGELKKEKKAIYTSLLKYSDIDIYTFKLKSSDDNILFDAESYLYNDIGLDVNKTYEIKYFYRKIDDNYVVTAVVVSEDILKSNFSEIIKKINYLDFITISPLSFISYYDLKNIKPKNDIFIYLDYEDSFVSFYSNKEFLTSKGLDKLSRLAKELDLSKNELFKLLEEKGLDETLYEDMLTYSKVNMFFMNIFNKINNIINYSNNIYSLTKIDTIYIYLPIKTKSLLSFVNDVFSLFSNLKIEFIEIDSEYDAFDVIATYFNAKNYNNDNVNFTIFKRPPPFFKQEIGKLIIFISFLIFVFLSVWIYQKIRLNFLSSDINIVSEKIRLLENKNKNLIVSYKKIRRELKNIENDMFKINNLINNYENTILFLKKIQNNKFLNNYFIIINGLQSYNLKVKSFYKKDHYYEVILNSDFNNSKSIAEFLHYLLINHFKNIKIEKILDNNNKYISKVSFYDK